MKALATAKLREIERKLAELEALKKMLGHLVHNCHGDQRPDCPIMDELSGHHHVQ